MSKTQIIPENVTLIPLGSNVLVRALDHERSTKSGIILPTADRSKALWADVVAVGAGRISENNVVLPMPIKPGQRVLYQRHSGTEILSGDKAAVLILDLDDIMAVVKDDHA